MEKVAALTGASRGIGAHLAEALSHAGYKLAIGSRDHETLVHMAHELTTEVLPFPLDVTDLDSIQSFADATIHQFGRVDLVINNAGVGIFKRLDELRRPDFRKIFSVNVEGAWLVSRAFLPELQRSRGTLVMMSSDVSTRTFETGGAYCASKFALRAITRTLQIEHPGIRVLELRPGATDTYFADSLPGAPGKEWFLSPKDVADTLLSVLSLPDNVRVEEVVVRSREQTPEF